MMSDGCQPMLHSHVRVEINFAYVSRAEPFAAVVEEVMKRRIQVGRLLDLQPASIGFPQSDSRTARGQGALVAG
jgi:hypothetical protein